MGDHLRESAFGQIQPVSLHPCRSTPPRRTPFPPCSRRDSGYVAKPPHLRETSGTTQGSPLPGFRYAVVL